MIVAADIVEATSTADLIALGIGSGTVVGTVVAIVRLLFNHRDQASTAYIDGFEKARKNAEADREADRAKHDAQLNGLRASFERELDDIRREVGRLHHAISELAALVPENQTKQAMAILTELNVRTPPNMGDTL